MNSLSRKLLGVAAVASVVGVVQAVLQTAVFAWLYRDLVFAPYRFFSRQMYDGFTKIYFWLGSYVPLPELMDRFLPQGIWSKVALFPDLAGANIFIAVAMSLLLAPVVGKFFPDGRLRAARVVAVVVAIEVCVHLAVWVASVKVPMEPTIAKVARNLVRDGLHDGVILSVALACVAGALATLLLRRVDAGSALVAVGILAAGLSFQDARISTAGVPGKGFPAAGGAPAQGMNVILMSIDSLRADHLGAYGYKRETSPVIDRLAREGVLFRHCSSTTSWTLPAHMSLLTGRSLLGHGVVGDDRALSPGVDTLAESFLEAGYSTGAVVSAPYVNSRYGFDRGFQRYDDDTISFDTNESSYKSVTAPLLIDTATDWIDGNSERPFFLFLHFWDVHYDFAPGPPYDTMFDPDYQGSVTGDDFYFSPEIHAGMDPRDLEHVKALYDGEIRLVDDHIGKLIAYLEKRGLAERTVIVVTADHGDEFFEHGKKGHHRTLYEEVLAVPLVVYVPGYRPARGMIQAESSVIDVMPTVLGLTGIPVPTRVEGMDWTPALAGGIPQQRLGVFAELYRKGSLNVQVSSVRARQKTIHHFDYRKLESYDLRADPGEQDGLPASAEPTTQSLDRLTHWLNQRWGAYSRREKKEGITPVVVDAKTTDALRALGYIE